MRTDYLGVVIRDNAKEDLQKLLVLSKLCSLYDYIHEGHLVLWKLANTARNKEYLLKCKILSHGKLHILGKPDGDIYVIADDKAALYLMGIENCKLQHLTISDVLEVLG